MGGISCSILSQSAYIYDTLQLCEWVWSLCLLMFRQVCLFLKRGASQAEVDEQGHDPLSIAVQAANADIVTLWVIFTLLSPQLNKILKHTSTIFNSQVGLQLNLLTSVVSTGIHRIFHSDSSKCNHFLYIFNTRHILILTCLSVWPLLQTAAGTDEWGDAGGGGSTGSTRSIPQQQPYRAAV